MSWESCSFWDPGQQKGKCRLLLKEILVLRSEKVGIRISRACHLTDRKSAEADKRSGESLGIGGVTYLLNGGI